MAATKYGNLIIDELKAPAHIMAGLPEYNKFGKRILWIDNNIVKGSFQMNASWYLRPRTQGPPPHAHDVDEIVGAAIYLASDASSYTSGSEIIIDGALQLFSPMNMAIQD